MRETGEHKHAMRSAIISLALLIASAIPAAPAAKHTVAVLPFENLSEDKSLDWLSMGAAETITNDLLAVPGLVLVERLQLNRVIEEHKLQASGAIDPETAVEMGKLVGADVLVLGSYQKFGETLRLTSRFVDVKTAGVIQTAKATGKMSEVFDLQDRIVRLLAKNLNISLRQRELAVIAKAPTRSLKAYEHFGQGALLQSKRDLVGAVRELEKATAADPGFDAAAEKFKDVFWSLEQGNSWTYASVTGTTVKSLDAMTATKVRRAGSRDRLAGRETFTYIEELEYTGGMNVQQVNVKHYYKGNDGIYEVGEVLATTTGGKTTDTVVTREPPILAYPYDLEAGKKWAVEYDHVVDGKRLATMKVNYRVSKRETLKVPAGTFTAFAIERAMENSSADPWRSAGDLSAWFVPGVGLVKTEGKVVTKVKPEHQKLLGKTMTTTISEVLTDYKLR